MESEKVKAIKKALEYCQGESLKSCEHCPYWNWCKEDDGLTFKSDILTLINELESENAEWKEIFDICNKREYRNKFNDEWRKEYQKELDKENDGAIAGLPDFDLVYKLYFEQKDRIAELEKQNAKNANCLKQFAERLKKKAKEIVAAENVDVLVELLRFSDELVKEFSNENGKF